MEQAKKRVLVVDDNRDGANSIGLVLRLLGNEVQTAYDGQQAVEAAQNFQPDVILMDLMMPRMSGLDAIRLIRDQSWGESIKIFALSGLGHENDWQLSAAAGSNGHVQKPIDVSALKRLLENLGET